MSQPSIVSVLPFRLQMSDKLRPLPPNLNLKQVKILNPYKPRQVTINPSSVLAKHLRACITDQQASTNSPPQQPSQYSSQPNTIQFPIEQNE